MMICRVTQRKIDLYYELVPKRDSIAKGRADTLAGDIRNHTHPAALLGMVGCADCHRYREEKELQVWGPENTTEIEETVSDQCTLVRAANRRYFDLRPTRRSPLTHHAREELGLIQPHITGADDTIRCEPCHRDYEQLEAERWGTEGQGPASKMAKIKRRNRYQPKQAAS